MLMASGERKCGLVLTLVLAAMFVGAFFASGAHAAEPRADKASGKIVDVGPDGVRIAGSLGTLVTIVISKERLTATKAEKTLTVTVNGEAEPNYLGKDQFVTFSAELNSSNTSTSEVDDVTIFTPDSTHPLEMVDTKPEMDDSESGAKRPASNRTSSYLISGQVQSFRDGQLLVKAPNERGRTLQIKVRLAENAVVKVHAGDFSMARPGDMIDAEGWTHDPAGPVGTLVAEKVTINGVKPFVNVKRARAIAAAKLAAEKQVRKPRPSKNAVVENEPEADEPVMTASNDATNAPAAAKPNSLRQAGDPPAEGIILVDGFSVDGNSGGAGGITALHVAARYGQAEVVDLLLEAGARADAPTKAEVTPLMIAAWQGHLAIVKALLAKGAPVASADSDGQTALMYAAASGKAEVVQLLLDHNAQANAKSKLRHNEKALSVAAWITQGSGRGGQVAAGRQRIGDRLWISKLESSCRRSHFSTHDRFVRVPYV